MSSNAFECFFFTPERCLLRSTQQPSSSSSSNHWSDSSVFDSFTLPASQLNLWSCKQSRLSSYTICTFQHRSGKSTSPSHKALPPVPAPKPKLTNTLANHHVYHNQHFSNNFPAMSGGTLGRNSTLSHIGHQQLIGSNSSNSSTPPSMSTTSTTNNCNGNSSHNPHLINQYQSATHLQPTYDRPDSVNKPYYAARVQTSSLSNNSTSSSSYDDRNSHNSTTITILTVKCSQMLLNVSVALPLSSKQTLHERSNS